MCTLSITAAIALMVWSVGGDKRHSNTKLSHKVHHEFHVLMVIGIISILILDLHEYNIAAIIDSVEEMSVFRPDRSDTAFVVFICAIESRPGVFRILSIIGAISESNKAIDALLYVLIAFDGAEYNIGEG